MNEPLAILFDLDDTLLSFDGVTDEAWEKCCSDFMGKYSVDFTKEELLSVIRKTKKWYWSDPVRHKTGRENLRDARREVVKLTLNELGVFNETQSNELADHYTDYQNELIHLLPHARKTLERFKDGGVRMGLVTNGSSEGQRAKLKRFHLSHFFEIILIDQEVGYGKPDPRIFEHALQVLKLSHRDVWMVGDHLIWDVKAPQEVGIYSIWNDYRKLGLPKESKVIPDRIIHNVSEL